jgi:hypothetical protein
MAEEKQDKKIIIDEDWKKQAQQEKEVLAAQEQEDKQEKGAEGEGPGKEGPLPQGNFAALISMLATQALFALGLIQIRGEDPRAPDLEMARYNIDMLETLAEKTKGNLTDEEQQVLSNTLSDLRMGFVSVANQVTSQQQ